MRKWLGLTALTLATGLLSGFVLGCASPAQQSTPVVRAAATELPEATPATGGPRADVATDSAAYARPAEFPSKGSPDAKVTILEFCDFIWPDCVRFAHQTARAVEQEYVAKGLVNFVFVDFALHGEPAVVNAEAAHCAQDQGKYWGYHDLLFDSDSEDQARYSRKQLEGFAAELGLDMATFRECLDTQKYQMFVTESTEEARLMGFKVIPSLLVNQRIIEGYVSFEDLQPIIEEELDKLE